MKRTILWPVCVLVALYFSVPANAAIVPVTLTDATLGFNTGAISSSSITGTLTGNFNTATGVVTMDAGTTAFAYTIILGLAYTHLQTNWSTGAGGYSADSFNCAEGSAGATISVSFCGGYEFGSNSIDESSLDYSTIPGTLVLGGDDMDVLTAATVQGSMYLTDTALLSGATLIMESATWTANPGAAGVQLTFAAVPIPVPAAIWMFGSAVVMLGWIRRRMV